MRIAQILPQLEVGGVETGTVDLVKALQKRGEEPYVISNGGALVDELIQAKIPHWKLPVHKKSIASLALVRRIAEWIERERIDIIHARSRVPAWLAYLAVRRTNCDFVTTCHGYYSKHFFSRVMGWGKRVIVISHSIGRRMIDDFGVPSERVTLIHRGVDLAQYPFVPDKYDRRFSGKYVILNIGRITPIKGQTDFVEAIHWLSKRIPNFEAWIVGSGDEKKEGYFGDLKLKVTQLGLGQKVKFLGLRRDIPELIRQADLVVLPSRIPEAFGRVLIEAGASGTAVCASRIGGILDVVEEGKTGLLFSPQHAEEMALVMERLLKDRALSKRFAHAFRRKVEEEFSLDQMVEKTNRVYSEVRRQKKILITKLGAVGDVILAVPSIRMLHKRFPEAQIALLIEPKLVPLVQHCPYLTELYTFDRAVTRDHWRHILRISKRIGQAHYDFSIDLQNNWRTHLIAFLARIPRRYGYRRGWLGFLLTHPVMEDSRQIGPIEHQFQVLRRSGVIHFDDTMELWPESHSEEWAAQELEKNGFDRSKPVIGFVVGSSAKWQTKRWPISRFGELAARLIERSDCRIVLVGTKEDQGLAESLNGRFQMNLIDFTGRTDLSQLISLVKHFDVLVSGDTAPLHVASAVGTKVVALFGPTDPKRHMPSGSGPISLVKRIQCQPCYRGTCTNREELLCLKSITVDEVYEAVERQLAR